MSRDYIYTEGLFVSGLSAFIGEVGATNIACNFISQDKLIDEFSEWLGTGSDEESKRFGPLVDAFRNARIGLKLMLVVSEAAEALEAVRKSLGPDDHIPEYTAEEAEIADAFIRLMNYSRDRKLRIGEAIVAKNRYNRTRKDHTPAGRAATHGKKF